MKKITLLEMKRNQRGRIIDISGGVALLSKMMSMGLYSGCEITKVGQMALRGAVTIKVGRAVIALGHGMAGKIILETE
ncbi:MAG: FeoA family protein [bacterium]